MRHDYRTNRTAPVRAELALARALTAGACALALGACTNAATWRAAVSTPSASPSPRVGVTPITPADGATEVPVSTELAYTIREKNVKRVDVLLTDDASGARMGGGLRADGSTWVPQQTLLYDTTYTVELTATDSDGRKTASTSTFTTMPAPEVTDHLTTPLGDGGQYGVGAPIVLNFSEPVADSQRAAVQRRLFVQSTPPQEGAWTWFSPTEVHYRPKTYWQTGTKISVRALFRGVPVGDDGYGDNDLTLDAAIADHDLRIVVDDHTKTLTVTQDGAVIKTMPASLGKAGTPSSSGNMVIMTKAATEVFDSANDGIGPGMPGYYRTTIDDALRLTWGGQYIHSAPWSVGQQGRDDVSHGCTNIGPANAAWLYNMVHLGDPVTVQNTGAGLEWGDGWTDWNRTWEDYLQDSAIPYAAPGAPPAAPSPTAPTN